MGASPRLALSTDRAPSLLLPLTNPVALSPTQQFFNGLLAAVQMRFRNGSHRVPVAIMAGRLRLPLDLD